MQDCPPALLNCLLMYISRSRLFLHRSCRPVFLLVPIALLCVLAIGLAVTPDARAAVLIAAEDVPATAVTDFVLADVTGDGSIHLVAVGDDSLVVLTPNEDFSWTELMSLPALPAPATAVAVGDFIGDGVPAIAIGTAQAGAVYLLRWTGTDWTVVAQTGYLWSPVADLTAADLDGDGRPELVTVDANGGITVFAWVNRALSPVWRWPTAMGRALQVEIAMLPDSDIPRLIVADDQDRVSVWSWPLTAPEAQAFVWGRPMALAVADVSGSGPEIIVSTNERLLYRYVLDSGRLIQTASPLHDARMPFDYMVPVRWSADATDRLLAYNSSGIGVWRVTTSSIARVDEGWANPPLAVAQWPGSDTLLIAEQTSQRGGTLRRWTRQPDGFFDLVVDGVPTALGDSPVFQQDHVMLSARDWANILDLQLYWDAPMQRLTVIGRRTYAIVTVGHREALLPAGVINVSLTPVLVDGRTYVPPEFPTWFGASYQWDPRRRAMSVDTTLPTDPTN